MKGYLKILINCIKSRCKYNKEFYGENLTDIEREDLYYEMVEFDINYTARVIECRKSARLNDNELLVEIKKFSKRLFRRLNNITNNDLKSIENHIENADSKKLKYVFRLVENNEIQDTEEKLKFWHYLCDLILYPFNNERAMNMMGIEEVKRLKYIIGELYLC